MKNIRKTVLFVMIYTISVLCFSTFAYADDNKGITAEIVTDRDEYLSNEKIGVEIKVTNTNDYDVNNINIKTTFPTELEIIKGDYLGQDKIIESLEAGASKSFKLTLKEKEEITILDEITPKSNVLDNASGEDNIKKVDKKVVNSAKTGDETNTLLFVITMCIIIAAIAIMIKKKVKFTKICSLLLCITIMLTTINTNDALASVSDNENIDTNCAVESVTSDFNVSKVIKVGQKEYLIKADITVNDTKATVKFDYNCNGNDGLTVENKRVDKNTLIDEIEQANREGYVFTGWYIDKECTERFDFDSTKIIDDTVIYAGWEVVDEDLIALENAIGAINIQFAIADNKDCVTNDIGLNDAVDGDESITLSWESSNNDIISTNGKVNRQTENVRVVMTLTASKNGKTVNKQFELKVCKKANILGEDINDYSLEDLADMNGEEFEFDYDDNGCISSLSGKYSDITIECPEDAVNSLHNIKSILRINDVNKELVPSNTNSDEFGTSYSLVQKYNDIVVFGRGITVSSDKDGNGNYISSAYLPDIELSIEHLLTQEQIVAKVKELFGQDVEINSLDTVIYSLDEYENNPVLAYVMKVGYNGGINSDTVFIRCDVGELIKSWSNIYDYNTGVYRTVEVNDEKGYKQTLNILYTEDKYYVSNNKIGIVNFPEVYYDSTAGAFINSSTWDYVSYSDTKKITKCEASAFVNLNGVNDWWKKTFNRKSIDGNGIEIIADVNVKGFIDNACYRGIVNNQALICFGEKTWWDYSKAAYPDVVAHEYMHGVTDFVTAQYWEKHSYWENGKALAEDATWNKSGKDVKYESLPYEGITGSINEAYSDIFGAFYSNSWIHGTSRNMINPNKSECPDKVGGKYYVNPTDTNNGNGGVHTNSTIISHAAYLMTIGNPNVNLSGGIHVAYPGLEDDEMEKLWYASLRKGYFSNSSWGKVRRNVLAAAKEIKLPYNKINTIKWAFDEVGITDEIAVQLTTSNNNGEKIKADVVKISNATNTYQANISSDGTITFPNIVQGLYTLTIEKDEYTTCTLTIEITKNLIKNIVLDGLWNCGITGKITVADEDMNMNNNQPLEGVKVHLKKLTGSMELEMDTITNASGVYKIDNIPSGRYLLNIEKDGYISTSQQITIAQGQINYYNAIIEAISEEYEGLGTATGKIYDALTGYGVDGVTVNIRSGLNITEGEIVSFITTSSNGSYVTPLIPAGHYCMEIVDSREDVEDEDRYMSSQFNIKILGNKNISNQDGALSTGLETDQLRIVLLWGATPYDLDSHLNGTSDSGAFHVFYGNKNYYSEDGQLIVNLDLDDTSAYGPETTTMYSSTDMLNHFSVYNYSGGGDDVLSNSGAYVQVYIGTSSVPIYTFDVPIGSGRTWNVFDYDSTSKKIIPINTIS